ncbi:MAG: hypothetical protein PSY12_09975 [bacterium]|nr:hypothetical protein [bacterium]
MRQLTQRLLASAGLVCAALLGYLFGSEINNSRALYQILHPVSSAEKLETKKSSTNVPMAESPAAGTTEQDAFTDLQADALYRRKDWFELEIFLANWAARDPYGAMDWAIGLERPHRVEALNQAMFGWFASEPDAAFEWAIRFDKKIFENERLYRVLVDAGRFDLGIQAINQLGYKGFADRALFRAWAERDPVDALASLELVGKKNSEDWLFAATGLVAVWGARDFPAAAAWLEANTKDSQRILLARDATAKAMASGQAEAVMNFIENMPTEAARDGYYIGLASASARNDPAEAARWLELVSDPNRKGTNVDIVLQIAYQRPDLAAHIIEQLSSPTLRDLRLTNLLVRWAQRDPTSAAAYAEKTKALSEGARTKVLARLNSGG